jgi:hypothetical protein
VAAVSPRTLPVPVIDPADLAAILPSLTPEEAALYASLATLVLEAALWPNEVPQPLPPPVNAAGLSIAVRLAYSGEAGGEGGAGPVVSESIGGYTYRLATPEALGEAMSLTNAERALLGPWLPVNASAFDISTLGSSYWWPPEWWQRDYDRLEAPPEPEVSP